MHPASSRIVILIFISTIFLILRQEVALNVIRRSRFPRIFYVSSDYDFILLASAFNHHRYFGLGSRSPHATHTRNPARNLVRIYIQKWNLYNLIINLQLE